MPVSRVRRLAYFNPVQDPQIKELIDKVNDIVDVSIIEQGSNANGEWRKWNDGTLECWGVKDLGTIDITINYGNKDIIFTSATYTVTWPAQFISIDYSSITINNGSQSYAMFTSLVPPTITSQSFILVRFSSLTGQAIKVGFYARGRWK